MLTGLVPANYIEKTESIGALKALYDYQPRSTEELGFKENDTLTLYEKDDTDWYFVQANNGEFGLIPSNYVEDSALSNNNNKSVAKPVCEPKWGIALYNFNPQDKEETQLREDEQVLVTDHVSSQDWWTVEHKDGTSGVVPATYIKFYDEYESEQNNRIEAEKRKLEQEELERITRMNEEQEKEKSRQIEVERRRRMQEEAKQKEIEAKKRQAAAAAAAAVKPPSAQLGNNSPRRSEIPAPLPPVSAPSVQNQLTMNSDPNRPDSAYVRWWTDRTGAFKVEAQLLSCSYGKIRLFKTNGVKIDVPVEKMCIEDLKYIERETGQKLLDDNVPLSQFSKQFSWLDYFKKINIPYEPSVRYAKAFEREGFSERDLERLTYGRMKSLGMTEKHVRRLQRFIETNTAEPVSDDESSKPRFNKKKSVTFGPVTYIEDYAVIVDGDEETGGYLLFEKDQQIIKDEQFARMLQEQENRQAQQPHVGLHRRPTGRPTPSHSAPAGVDFNTLANTKANQEPLNPTPSQPQIPLLLPASSQHAAAISHQQQAPITSQSGFEDDAWTPRPSQSPSIQSSTFNSVSVTSTTASSTQPRQRPAPQISQQSLVDPQLLSKWGGSSPLAVIAPISDPIPSNNLLGYNQANVAFNQSNPLALQQQQQTALGSQSPLTPSNNGFNGASPSFQSQKPALNQFNSLTTSNNSFTGASPSLQSQQLDHGHLAPMATGNNSFTGTSPSLQQQSSFNTLTVGNNNFTGSSPSLQNQQLGQSNSFTTVNNNFTVASSSLQSTGFISPSPSLQHLQSSPSMHTTSLQSGLPPMVPQSSIIPIQPQTTAARNWASATPDNPFGNRSMSAPTLQSNLPIFNPPQSTGYIANNVDPNDKYSIFKTIDASAPSILKPAAPFQQQQTGFVQMQPQQYNSTFMNSQQHQW
ncbi:unnamed protein product [Rhizopus stolonifer]